MHAELPDVPGYDVEAELGRGGMGVVYRARRRATGELLALKMIVCGRGATFLELARFRVEAEALACLDHPNIVKIRDVGVHRGYPYIALDYAEKGSLRQLTRGRPQPAGWSAGLVRTLAEAMQHAHGRGMLHRDLKPANVLVMGDGTPQISDFGIVKFAAPIAEVSAACCTFSVSALDAELARFARELGAPYESVADAAVAGEDAVTRSLWRQCAARTGALTGEGVLGSVRGFLAEARRQAAASPPLDGLTRPGSVMGTPGYMAPEQAAGDLARIGPATDVYALGGVLYELLTGRPPFDAKGLAEILLQVLSHPPRPPRQSEPGVPSELEAICLRCLEKDVARRYPSASGLADALRRFERSYPGDAQPAPAGEGETPRRMSPPPAQTPTLPDANRDPSARGTQTRTWWPFGRKSGGG